jgi:heat shock protein HslJ
MNRSRPGPWLLLPICFAVSVSCQSTGDRAKTAREVAPLEAPTAQELGNATYRGFEGLEYPVTLVDGRWEGEPYVPGAASRPRVFLVDNLRLTGDIDGDGADEAVVLLVQDSGGSGEFSYVAVVGHRNGKTENLDTKPIGDRVQIRAARIEGSRVALDVVRAGPEDPACCPGELATMEWEMTEQGLSAVAETAETGRLSLDTILDIEWTLKKWDRDEAAKATPEVVLKYTDGRLLGIGGCNNFFTTGQPGTQPGDLAIELPGRTRKACRESEMAVEERFLRQLAGVRKFGFVNQRLALTYEVDGTYGTMLFDRRRSATDRE